MALINCSECGKDVSDQASNCPGCGAKVPPKGLSAIFSGTLRLGLALIALGIALPIAFIMLAFVWTMIFN